MTTGPCHSRILRTNPALKALSELGLIHPDPLGLGIRVRDACRTIDAAGAPSRTLFVSGPLARGHVGELMGVPEVTGHAEMVAQVVRSELEARTGCVMAASKVL